jgi:uncharacterized protein (TIGR02996 family)
VSRVAGSGLPVAGGRCNAPDVLGLQLVGTAHGLTRKLSEVAGDRLEVLPGPYVELMERWGPGRLCDVFELPDPTAERFRLLQQRLRVEGAARRLAGAWAALSDAELQRGWVLGVDRRGLAVFARSSTSIVLLHPAGYVLEIGTFEDLVGKFLLSGQLVLTHHAFFKNAARDWRWAVRYREEATRNDLGVPASYVTDAPSPRADLLAAWAEGDEEAADAALAQVLEAEVTAFAMFELFCFLASPAAAHVPAEIRATYADQLFRAARRRVPALVPDLPIRDIRIGLEQGELAPELLAQAEAMLERADGIFVGAADAAERALLETLAREPSDDAARAVYADHLEERGELARAEVLRAEAAHVEPLPDAAERGFVAPPDLPPIDGPARIRERVAQWEAADPGFSLEEALARIDALHPVARQGYEILLAQVAGRNTWRLSHHAPAAHGHLVREIADAWPQLALALRGSGAPAVLAILREARVRQAAPFVLSSLRHLKLFESGESWHTSGIYDGEPWSLQLADAYLELGRMTKDLREEFIPYLATGAKIQPIHEPRAEYPGVATLRAVAFRFLADAGADDRVFEGALRFFCEGHPYSERIVRKRKTDPRVRQVLGEQLAAEEKKSLRDGGRRLAYTPELGLLARYLASLGDPHAKELAARYQKYKRLWLGGERDRYE